MTTNLYINREGGEVPIQAALGRRGMAYPHMVSALNRLRVEKPGEEPEQEAALEAAIASRDAHVNAAWADLQAEGFAVDNPGGGQTWFAYAPDGEVMSLPNMAKAKTQRDAIVTVVRAQRPDPNEVGA